MMFPLQYLGAGEFRCPHKGRADKELVIGETLTWEIVHHRSSETHRHYFACIKNGWDNLPDSLAMEYPSPKHLRKRALIKCGYCTMQKTVCASAQEAVGLVAFMAALDEFALITLDDCVVTAWKAESQRIRSMGKARFQESKERVLHWISDLVGADVAKEAA